MKRLTSMRWCEGRGKEGEEQGGKEYHQRLVRYRKALYYTFSGGLESCFNEVLIRVHFAVLRSNYAFITRYYAVITRYYAVITRYYAVITRYYAVIRKNTRYYAQYALIRGNTRYYAQGVQRNTRVNTPSVLSDNAFRAC